MTNPEIGNRRFFFLLPECLLILLLVLPVTVFAQDPIDLTIGVTSAFPWSITDIIPGDHGSAFIDLHNNGTENGIVYIWVNNISQTDRYGNPGGGLANYMYFNISHPHLTSTVNLPAHIDLFPSAPLLQNYIIINPLNVGDTIRLNWTWEFTDTEQPQNDAQNNTLQFNISYTLVNLTAPPVPPIIPPVVPVGGPGSPANNPAGSSGLLSGDHQGKNPAQRLQLRAPTEEPTEGPTEGPTEAPQKVVPQQSDLPDPRVIMIIAFIMLAIALTVYSQQKKHPDWKGPAYVLLGVGIAVTIIGILYQTYLISTRNGQHLSTIHSVAGLIATILIIPVLVFWNRQNDQKEKEDKKIVWIYVLWVVTSIECLVLGLWMVGII
ncbi:MAG: hypothetical protein ABSE07_10995 [Methanoregula sp.]